MAILVARATRRIAAAAAAANARRQLRQLAAPCLPSRDAATIARTLRTQCNSFERRGPPLAPISVSGLHATSFRSQHATRDLCRQIAVIGAGQMGVGIAYVAAVVAAIPVVLIDSNTTQLERGISFIDALLQKNVNKGKLSPETRDRALELISSSTSLKAAANVDFLIEAVPERIEIKASVMRDAAEHLQNSNTVLATNTSSISITKIAASVPHKLRPDVIGMHFMNPVPIMPLIEIIPGLETSAHTIARTERLASAMQKTTAISRDVPGFVANRLLMPYLNEAIFALHEGLATRDDIDRTMLLGTNMPMGPLALSDFIGLDTVYNILTVLHQQLGETKFRPCPLLRNYVDAGWLGKKSGRGFYDYTVEQPITHANHGQKKN